MALPTVAIIGRPNVGKSTLFNRLIQRQEAIVNETAGVTRDRHYAEAEWLGQTFRLVDTGGIVAEHMSELTEAVQAQTEYAMAEAQLILFMINAREGATATDHDIAMQLRKIDKPVLFVANKVDAVTGFERRQPQLVAS
jgi:GTP-binding protein